MRRAWVGLTAATVVMALAGPAALAAAAADEQERLDAAMEEFNTRMTDAGWMSQGPSGDDDDDEDEEDDGVADDAGDDAFAACVGDVAVVFEGADDDEFPGELARSESDEFSYAPESDATATTEPFSFDLTEESTAAFAITVDDASVGTVTQLLEVFGSKATTDCLRQGFEADMAADSDDSEMPVEFEIEVTNESNLGIGDHSAAIGYSLSVVFMMPIVVDVEIVLAQTGNDLVGVYHLVSGEPQTDFDPREELQAIVDSLAA